MIAGLLFAQTELEDQPGQLVATAPFGGVTLIEYQARLLAALGASQVVVAVARMTPALTGALTRIGARGVTVDAVRSAREVAGVLHPLADVVMLADGLLATADTLEPLLAREGDALLVVERTGAGPGWELLGGGNAYAGAGRLAAPRIAEAAALPADYDLPSALLRPFILLVICSCSFSYISP